jgi:hypothetical protein
MSNNVRGESIELRKMSFDRLRMIGIVDSYTAYSCAGP